MPSAATGPAHRKPDPSGAETGAAFFDVDNTLMRGASLFHVGRKMYQRGAFRMRDVAGFAIKQGKFLWRGENLKDIQSVRDTAMALGAGLMVIAEGSDLFALARRRLVRAGLAPGAIHGAEFIIDGGTLEHVFDPDLGEFDGELRHCRSADAGGVPGPRPRRRSTGTGVSTTACSDGDTSFSRFARVTMAINRYPRLGTVSMYRV